MAEFLLVAGKLLLAISIFVVFTLLYKTTDYFISLPEKDKHKPLLAWDILALFVVLMYMFIQLIK